MKTFLKILLAANFLLQISMGNEKSKLDEDKGGEKDEGTTDTEQDQRTPDPNQDYRTSKLAEDEEYGQHEDDEEEEEHEEYEEEEDYEEYEEEEDYEEYQKTSEYQVDEGSEEDQETEEPDNVIYPDDIVPCDILSTQKKKVQKEIVKCHNELRSNVTPSAGNMLKMKWSKKLMESAGRWAETCNLNHSEVKDRIDNGVPYGENILSAPACIKWDMTIKQWFNEKAYLIWGVGPIGDNVTGHYTQLVTYYTFKMGCAFKKCIVNGTVHAFFVCQYYPPGNRESSHYRPYEEGEPCSLCRTACDESGKLCLNSCSHTDTIGNCLAIKNVGACEEFNQACEATCLCKNKIT